MNWNVSKNRSFKLVTPALVLWGLADVTSVLAQPSKGVKPDQLAPYVACYQSIRTRLEPSLGFKFENKTGAEGLFLIPTTRKSKDKELAAMMAFTGGKPYKVIVPEPSEDEYSWSEEWTEGREGAYGKRYFFKLEVPGRKDPLYVSHIAETPNHETPMQTVVTWQRDSTFTGAITKDGKPFPRRREVRTPKKKIMESEDLPNDVSSKNIKRLENGKYEITTYKVEVLPPGKLPVVKALIPNEADDPMLIEARILITSYIRKKAPFVEEAFLKEFEAKLFEWKIKADASIEFAQTVPRPSTKELRSLLDACREMASREAAKSRPGEIPPVQKLIESIENKLSRCASMVGAPPCLEFSDPQSVGADSVQPATPGNAGVAQ